MKIIITIEIPDTAAVVVSGSEEKAAEALKTVKKGQGEIIETIKPSIVANDIFGRAKNQQL